MRKFKILLLAVYMGLTMPAMGVDEDCFKVMNSKPSVGVDCCVNNLAGETNVYNPDGALEMCTRCNAVGDVIDRSCRYLGVMYDTSCTTKHVFSGNTIPTGVPKCCLEKTSITDATTHIVNFLSCKNTMTEEAHWAGWNPSEGYLWYNYRKTSCDCSHESYGCDIGYYGNPTTLKGVCTRCPALDSTNPNTYGTTAAIGAKDVTECFIPKKGTHKGSTGTYTFVENCGY